MRSASIANCTSSFFCSGLPNSSLVATKAAAALAAQAIDPAITPWFIASHCSQETGHQLALAALGLTPLLDLGFRLGEGSGAAAAIPLLQQAIALHAGMATFAEAGVAGKSEPA